MTAHARAAIDALTRLEPRDRIALCMGALLASPPGLVEAEAAELPDRVAQQLAALILAPQVRAAAAQAGAGPEVN